MAAENLRKHLKNFLLISGGGGGARSQKSVNWMALKFKDLTESPLIILPRVPVARNAVLDYFGVLTLENVHWFLFQIENPNTAIDIGYIDDAVVEAVRQMQSLVSSEPETWAQLIFEWVLETLSEVSRRNMNRRPLAVNPLTESLKLYTSNRATRAVLELLNHCTKILLQISPERCVSALLELSVKYGGFCDWILTYIGLAFPEMIIGQLLKCGVSDLHSYLNEMIQKLPISTHNFIAQRSEHYGREKLASLASILTHLARQQNTELKACFSSLIQKALKSETLTKDQYTIILLLKLAGCSRDIAEILIDDLGNFATVPNLLFARRIVNKIPCQLLFSEPKFVDAIANIVCTLQDSPCILFIFEKLNRIAFDNTNSLLLEYNDIIPEELLIDEFQKSALQILDTLANSIEKAVHSQYTLSLKSLPILERLNQNFYDLVRLLLSKNDNESRYYLKLACLLCMIQGVETFSAILAHILFMAENPRELGMFANLCSILAPFFPSVFDEFVKKLRHYLDADSAHDHVDEQLWIKNLHILIEYEHDTTKKKAVNFPSLTKAILNNYCCFIDHSAKFCFSAPEHGETLLAIFRSIGQPVHLLTSHSLHVLSFLIRLHCHSLMKSGDLKSFKFHTAVCDYIVQFLSSQTSLVTEAFLKLFFRAYLFDDQWRTYFSTPIVQSTSSNAMDWQPDSKGDNVFNHSSGLLIENRNLTSRQTAANLVHSGLIGRGIRPNSGQLSKTEISRKSAFVKFVSRLCQNRPNPNAPSNITSPPSWNIDICRQIAFLLNDHICPDAIASEYCWDDWEYSRSNIERLLAISKRVRDLPFTWDLLSIVAEGYPSLWYALPILKAVLACLMLQFESCVNKTEKSSPQFLATLKIWFYITTKGKLLCSPLTYLYDVIERVSNYEAFLVLLQIWRYFQEVTPDSKSLNQHFEYNSQFEDNKTNIIADSAASFLEPVRVIMQANIGQVGYLFPQIFDLSTTMEELQIVEA